MRYPPPLPSDVPIMYGEEYYVGANTRCPVVYDISIEIEYTSCCAEYHRSSNNMGGVNTIQSNGNYYYWNSKRIKWPKLTMCALWWNSF